MIEGLRNPKIVESGEKQKKPKSKQQKPKRAPMLLESSSEESKRNQSQSSRSQNKGRKMSFLRKMWTALLPILTHTYDRVTLHYRTSVGCF